MSCETALEDLLKEKKVLFISTKNIDYLRNTQEIEIIQNRSSTSDIIAFSDKSYLKRILKVYLKCLKVLFSSKYDVVFIDAAKGKYPFFLKEALRMIEPNGIIFADNILYKGYVMSDYNKHKQRTAVRNLREYIKEVSENPNLETEILEVGDGLAISRIK